MFKIFLSALVFVAIAFSAVRAASADPSIDGIWKHADKDAEIMINLESGLATVSSHAENPDATGLTVIKDLQLVPGESMRWRGLMFNGYEDAYDSVSISIDAQGILSVVNEEGIEVLRLIR